MIASGANLDDLGDYRPGLTAAAERKVVHPYVEAKVTKAELRGIARRLGLGDVASLPAQPCLASRVETGIPIDADDLGFIHRAEALAASGGGAGDIRCRITAAGVRLESGGALADGVVSAVERLCRETGRRFLGVAPYRRGSAFLKDGAR